MEVVHDDAAKGRRSEIATVQGMFKYFNSFMEAERNSVEVFILDEAHRSAKRLRTDTHAPNIDLAGPRSCRQITEIEDLLAEFHPERITECVKGACG